MRLDVIYLGVDGQIDNGNSSDAAADGGIGYIKVIPRWIERNAIDAE